MIEDYINTIPHQFLKADSTSVIDGTPYQHDQLLTKENSVLIVHTRPPCMIKRPPVIGIELHTL